MQVTQLRPSNRGQSERFPKSSSTTRGIDGAQLWPTRAGDRLHTLVRRRRRALSNRSEDDKQSPNFGSDVRRPTALQQFFASFSLERSFTLFGFMVAVILMSFFGLDLACGWPFRRASVLFDVTSTVCGAVLGFLCWDVFWEQVKGQTR
jgi:hypothetical protein